MRWENYEQLASDRWQALLQANTKPGEASFHRFLEQHPSLLPHPRGDLGFGHHGVFPMAAISQPVLPDFLSRKIPDFLWIARDSDAVHAALIEIEDPSKPWATKSGQQSHQLTQAIDQIKDWKAYFAEPSNAVRFLDQYQVPRDFHRSRGFVQHYVLIYGRRSDPTLTPNVTKKRHQLQGDREHFMTYDRLSFNGALSGVVSVQLTASGYKALWVPPTIELGPANAAMFEQIAGKEEATAKSPYFSDARRRFVEQRWAYWDNWVRQSDHQSYSSRDTE